MSSEEELAALLDEDEAIANAAAGAGPMGPEHARWMPGYGMLIDADDHDWAITTETLDEIVQHFARHDPARVRRFVAAGRAIIRESSGDGHGWAEYEPSYYAGLDFAVRCLAEAYDES